MDAAGDAGEDWRQGGLDGRYAIFQERIRRLGAGNVARGYQKGTDVQGGAHDRAKFQGPLPGFFDNRMGSVVS